MPYRSNRNYRVTVPKRSGFDKSHRNTGTGLCGTLIPLLCDEVIPSTRVSLKLNLAAQLPPLVSDTFMNCKIKCEAFFVPGRLLCKSYEDWFCDFPKRVLAPDSYTEPNTFVNAFARLPVATLNRYSNDYIGAGSLADYLGIRGATFSASNSASLTINLLPFVAYHLVWQEFYRNPRVQNPAFVESLVYSSQGIPRACSLPYSYFVGESDGVSAFYDFGVLASSSYRGDEFGLADGLSLFDLRQRNFSQDYFTNARVSPQQGDAVGLEMSVDGDAASFTIASLRAANSLQQFRERNNLPSPRLVDQVKARYGANLSDGVAQRPICIGTASYDVSSTGVNQTSPRPSEVDERFNPFNSVGAQYGRAYGAGSDFIISDFTANEPGYIMVLMSFVPEVTYAEGVLPMFRRYIADGSIVEMATPLLQNVGDQPIYQDELRPARTLSEVPQIFGYTDRYSDFMYLPNTVHGEMRYGRTLSSFVLQRVFAQMPELGSSFLEIPTTYLDPITVVSLNDDPMSDIGFSYWYDCMLEYKVSMPLAEYSIPSLQDPAYEHGESVVLRRNGQIF